MKVIINKYVTGNNYYYYYYHYNSSPETENVRFIVLAINALFLT